MALVEFTRSAGKSCARIAFVGSALLRSSEGGVASFARYWRLAHTLAKGQRLFATLTAGKLRNDPVFTRDDGGIWGKSHQLRPMQEASHRAKIKPAISFHVLRHTHGSTHCRAARPRRHADDRKALCAPGAELRRRHDRRLRRFQRQRGDRRHVGQSEHRFDRHQDVYATGATRLSDGLLSQIADRLAAMSAPPVREGLHPRVAVPGNLVLAE